MAGSQAAQIALLFRLYDETRSGAWVATGLFASMSVGGLLGPVSGWIADRFDRRRVMVLSELAAGAAYVALILANGPVRLVAGTVAATVLGAPFRAASLAALPNLVEADDLPWANGLMGTASNVALVAGPFVGGALVAASGVDLVFAVNAVSFLVSAVAIATTPGRFGGGRAAAAAEGHADATAGVLAGFHVVARSPLLMALAAASAMAFCSFGAALVIDPALAKDFHAGSVGYGLLTTVWGGGAVAGAMLAGRIVTVARAPAAVVWGMIGMTVSLGSVVVLPTFALIVAAGAIGGVGNGFVFVPWLLLVQHHVADAVRGRVVAATEAFDQVTFLLGMALAIPALSWVGPQRSYGLTAALLAIATAAALRATVASTATGDAAELASPVPS